MVTSKVVKELSEGERLRFGLKVETEMQKTEVPQQQDDDRDEE